MTTSWVYWPYSAAGCNLCIVAPPQWFARASWDPNCTFTGCLAIQWLVQSMCVGLFPFEYVYHRLQEFGKIASWHLYVSMISAKIQSDPSRYFNTAAVGLTVFFCHWFGWCIHKYMVFFYGKPSCPAWGASWWTPFLAQVCSGMTPMDISQCGLDETSISKQAIVIVCTCIVYVCVSCVLHMYIYIYIYIYLLIYLFIYLFIWIYTWYLWLWYLCICWRSLQECSCRPAGRSHPTARHVVNEAGFEAREPGGTPISIISSQGFLPNSGIAHT